MRALELRIPPPLVTLVVGVVMWMTAPQGSRLATDHPLAVHVMAAGVAAAGLLVAVAAAVSFLQARTTISPLKPETTTALVTSGIYACTRNPMYLGMLLALVGWAMYLNSLLAFVGPVVFALYIQRFQIVPEERVLLTLFGDAYDQYRRRVRRWV